MIATPSVELLTCQPYASVKTSLQDLGLGQGLNVVFGLAKQFVLKEGTKVACDNLFNKFYLLDYFTDSAWVWRPAPDHHGLWAPVQIQVVHRPQPDAGDADHPLDCTDRSRPP